MSPLRGDVTDDHRRSPVGRLGDHRDVNPLDHERRSDYMVETTETARSRAATGGVSYPMDSEYNAPSPFLVSQHSATIACVKSAIAKLLFTVRHKNVQVSPKSKILIRL